MRFTSRTWFLLSVLLFVGAVFFWRLGDEYQARKQGHPAVPEPQTAQGSTAQSSPSNPFQLLTQVGPSFLQIASSNLNRTPMGPRPDRKNGFVLSNTGESGQALARRESAILLQNALIDTALPAELAIPAHLRSDGPTLSYIVQARGPIDAAFRQRLDDAAAKLVAYIPNNAFLVRVDPAVVRQLAGMPEVQSVLSFEPYFKLAPKLVPFAVEQRDIPSEGWLQITMFPGEKESGVDALTRLGAQVIFEEKSPFGPQVIVRAEPNSLSQIARLDVVQTIEPYYQRQFANDRTRVRLGVATDGVTNANYLGLTGTNVLVAVNDSGVDTQHPDFAGRIFTGANYLDPDTIGHGTHVVGTIAGNGSQSGSVGKTPDGSPTNANFRGMAPAARVFVLPTTFSPDVNIPVSDTFLQETAARTNFFIFRRTNATLISNNSWTYVGATEYDSAAARYDAAVRDSLDLITNSQPVAYVFAAGDIGFGSANGLNGEPNSISSPATAKNVITVGALESFRKITNAFFTDTNGMIVDVPSDDGSTRTNRPFVPFSDSDSEVGSFSARGNTGIGSEGEFGRFKPDVVAPGMFIISTRSRDWRLENDIDTNSPLYKILRDLNAPLGPSYRYASGSSMAAASVSGLLALVQNFFETRFGNTLPTQFRRTLSPALMKALLINGARSVGPLYDYQVDNVINFQGWGIPSLTNTIPTHMSASPFSDSTWPARFFDQHPTNSLATGEQKSWRVGLSDDAAQYPLRVTLVWTDPPGNPSAGIKLVNDLDLVVSNTVTKQVYYGNNIPAGSDFTQASDGDVTNSPPVHDFINNVENVFTEPGGSNFVVTVQARRVNVNSVFQYNLDTRRTNDIVQDFALVISSANTTLTNAFRSAFTVISNAPLAQLPPLTMTNGVPLLNQRVGAHSSINTRPNGRPEQWNFYVFTNKFDTNAIQFSTLTNGSNVAFVTFQTPNLARARNLEADIDLYVSRNDPGLLTLNAASVANSDKSTGRGGTEYVIYTNATPADVFYIAVKSEDQQAAEFGLIAISTDEPFDEDDNGSRIITGFPTGAVIPDGTANQPSAAYIIGIGIRREQPVMIQRAIVTNTIVHENLGDLLGNLSHNGQFAVLNNHTLDGLSGFSGTNTFVYDDSEFAQLGRIPAPNAPTGEALYKYSDGPGSLSSFFGQETDGVWQFNMIDNSPTHTGRVEMVKIRLEPLQGGDLGAFGADGVDGTVGPNSTIYYFLDVPSEATNMIIRLSQMTGSLDVLLRREAQPTRVVNDKAQRVDPPGGDVTLSIYDQPEPLSPGRYFIGLYNPNGVAVDFHIASLFEFGFLLRSEGTFTSPLGIPIADYGKTRVTYDVFDDRTVADVSLGLRIVHPRVSDLVMHLVSPQGTRILLAENRGGLDTNGYGTSILRTETLFRSSPPGGSTEADVFPVSTGTNSGTIRIAYNFFEAPDRMRVRYDGAIVFDSGIVRGSRVVDVSYGPGSSTNVVIIMNEGGSSQVSTFWEYRVTLTTGSHYLAMFTENTNSAKMPIKFAVPPFAAQNIIPGLIDFSGFEGVQPRVYVPGETVDRWQVATDPVSVIFNGQEAHTGSNYLALGTGRISRVLPTVAGKEYRLKYAQRGCVAPAPISWWPGDGNANDRLDGNHGFATNVTFEAGVVGTGFRFNGVNSSIRIPYALNFPVAEASVEAWIKPIAPVATETLIFGQTDGHPQLVAVRGIPQDTGIRVGFGFTMPDRSRALVVSQTQLPLGQFHHVAGTWDGIDLKIYVNGTLAGTSRPAGQAGPNTCPAFIGGYDDSSSACERVGDVFNGVIDELAVYDQGLSDCEVADIYESVTTGSCTTKPCFIDTRFIFSGGVTNFVRLTSEWRTNQFQFVAAGPTDLDIIGGQVDVLVDSFELEETGIVYYLPEESLKLLRGERTAGRWTLEIADTRAGGTTSDQTLIMSQLNLKFGSVKREQRAVVLTNGVPYSGILLTNQTNYFIVEACTNTTLAINLLSGPYDRLMLLGDRTGFPTGSPFTDDYVPIRNLDPIQDPLPQIGFANLTLTTNSALAAPLQPGQRYFLAVHNQYFDETNSYTLQLTFDQGDCAGSVRPVISLEDGVPYTNSIPPSPPSQRIFDYYVFNVSTNAASVTFELSPQNADMGMVVRKGPAPPYPDFNAYDFISDFPGITNEVVVVATNTRPRLEPGEWYIGVYSHSTSVATYSITATETTRNIITITDLIDGEPQTNIVSAGRVLTNFFRFEITNDPPAVFFETYNMSGNGELLVDYERLPSESQYFNRRSGGPGAPATIVVRPNEMASNTLDGEWFLTVINLEPNDLTFTISATTLSTNITINSLESGTALTRTIPGTRVGRPNEVEYFEFNVTSNALAIEFELVPANGNLDLFVRRDLPLPSQSSFDYESVNGSSASEFIRVTPRSSPVPLTEGTWYVAVVNREIFDVNYTIRATEIRPIITTLEDGVAHSAVIFPGDLLQYYKYTVSARPVRAHFELLNPSGPVDLYIRKGLPLPGPGSFDYTTEGLPSAAELVVIKTNTFPVALAPGDWYLAVTNSGITSVDYQVRVTEFTTFNPPADVFLDPFPRYTTNGVVLTWSADPNQRFQVQFTDSFFPTAWNTISTVITSTTPNYSFTDDGTQSGGLSPMRFYRLRLVP